MSNQSKKETMENYTGEKRTPVKAIRAYCLECCLYSAHEVQLCTAYSCPLYPYRRGENSFNILSDAELQKRGDRAKASFHRGDSDHRMEITEKL